MAASSNTLHAPRERLSRETIDFHHAIVSLMEELEAVDWYRQRADDCDDTQLKEILLHNMREEMEHAAMVLEWIRRHNGDFDKALRDYMFKEGDIPAHQNHQDGRGCRPAAGADPSRPLRGGPNGRPSRRARGCT